MKQTEKKTKFYFVDLRSYAKMSKDQHEPIFKSVFIYMFESKFFFRFANWNWLNGMLNEDIEYNHSAVAIYWKNSFEYTFLNLKCDIDKRRWKIYLKLAISQSEQNKNINNIFRKLLATVLLPFQG